MKRITDVTRMEIFDCIKSGFDIYEEDIKIDIYDRQYVDEKLVHIQMTFSGKIDELKFLDRVFDLKNTPSTDNRFKNAEGDIWQHTVNNYDWQDPFWFLEYNPFDLENGEDDILLNFLCEMFHPAVRNEKEPWENFLIKFNELLKYDGYILCEKEKVSGRVVYGWREYTHNNEMATIQANDLVCCFNSDYISSQIKLMLSSTESNPSDAIGRAKELMESCCKTILEEKGVTFDKNWQLQRLVKESCKILKLTPDDIPETAKASETIKQILGSLSSISQSMAELRNSYGSGHGKSAKFKGLSPRHANLAVGTAIATVKFLWDTFQEQRNENK